MTRTMIERAEALIKPMQCYTETWLVEAGKVLPKLVVEIKRLQSQVENCHAAKNLHAQRSEKLQEQLSTWQAKAIMERCKTIAFAPTNARKDEYMRHRAQAAKELAIEASQLANYLERLEAAFLDAKKSELYFREYSKRGDVTLPDAYERSAREAQAALDKLRAGE